MTLSDLGRKDGAPELRPRARLIYLLVALAFVGIMARLIFLQAIRANAIATCRRIIGFASRGFSARAA